jgi:hypothetical protein
MTEKEIYKRACDVAMEEDSLRHGSLGFAKQDSDYELIVESYFEGAMWAREQAVKEERERALNAFEKVNLMCEACNKKCSVECGEDCLKNHFIKLLTE